jgi:hypothetical protein
MRRALFVIALLSAVPAAAQIQSRPTDPPIVTADNDAWYQRGEPLQFAGDVYYPAGAAVFFNGNTMVRTGNFNGVPLYTDATVEPYSQVLVPLSRGLMQPYERRRSGALAGTTGSRTPGFPVQVSTTAPSAISGPAVVSAPSPARSSVTLDEPRPVGTAGYLTAAPSRPAQPLVTARRPENNDGVWVEFGGEKWVSAGMAIPWSADFVRVGERAGFPVFARRGLKEEMIYLPTRPGVVAPYRLKN